MPRLFGWMGDSGWRPLVEQTGDGFRVNLGRVEQRVVMESLDDLRVMLANHDPATRRLFPTAYPDHAQLDAEYHEMVGDDLLRSQLDALDTVERTIGGETVDRDELEAWMRALNSVRLALGTKLDVSEDSLEIDPDDPGAHDMAVYQVLTIMLGAVVQALST
jgi:hypothetical protein